MVKEKSNDIQKKSKANKVMFILQVLFCFPVLLLLGLVVSLESTAQYFWSILKFNIDSDIHTLTNSYKKYWKGEHIKTAMQRRFRQ